MHKAFKWSALATAAAVAVGSTAAVAAEGGVPEALNRVNATLNALIATVNQLATSVNQLVSAGGTPTGPSTLISAPFLVGSHRGAGCNVVNVGPTVASVRTSIINGSTGAVWEGITSLSSIPAGRVSFSSVNLGNVGASAPVYCKFEADVPAVQLRAQGLYFENEALAATAEAR